MPQLEAFEGGVEVNGRRVRPTPAGAGELSTVSEERTNELLAEGGRERARRVSC